MSPLSSSPTGTTSASTPIAGMIRRTGSLTGCVYTVVVVASTRFTGSATAQPASVTDVTETIRRYGIPLYEETEQDQKTRHSHEQEEGRRPPSGSAAPLSRSIHCPLLSTHGHRAFICLQYAAADPYNRSRQDTGEHGACQNENDQSAVTTAGHGPSTGLDVTRLGDPPQDGVRRQKS